MTTEYENGILDGYLLTRGIVERVIAESDITKASRRRLCDEFHYIRERIMEDRAVVIKTRFEIL
jgi:hypothetical protein